MRVMMSDAWITIRFDDCGRAYRPGELLSGSYFLHGVSGPEIRATELSILWHTEGKGDEDLAVHHFQRAVAEENQPGGLPRSGRFQTVLPPAPLSYSGAIVKIRWCVRIRVFTSQGKEIVGERGFRLGDIPSVRLMSQQRAAAAAPLKPEETVDTAAF
jgi:hypothetical protein